jgi:biotin operon repressor
MSRTRRSRKQAVIDDAISEALAAGSVDPESRTTPAAPNAEAESIEAMVGLFRALADPTRLRLLGLLVERERCGQDLASELRLSPATVSHHLRLLRAEGLVEERRERPYTFYRLELGSLREALRSLADRKPLQSFAAQEALPADELKILRTFFDGSRLLSIPTQRRKKEIVFEEILRRLPWRKEYAEGELSRWIEAIHPDYATIRREFIMGRYMEREDGVYYLTDKGRRAANR